MKLVFYIETNKRFNYKVGILKEEFEMGIEGGWWSFTPEIEYETCPECGGTGKDNATLDWKCYVCNGLGRIKKKNSEDDD